MGALEHAALGTGVGAYRGEHSVQDLGVQPRFLVSSKKQTWPGRPVESQSLSEKTTT